MTAYALHAPTGAQPGDARALDKAEVVKDGFAWPVLVVQVLWFVWHRLWLGALAMLVATTGLAVLCRALNVSIGATVLAEIALVVFFALEGNGIRAWTLKRRGRPAVDVTVADDRDSAEAKLIARWLGRAPEPAGAAPPSTFAARPATPLGLFPEPEGRR